MPKTFVRPVLTFMRNEASGGIIMLAATVLALIWANSTFGHVYFDIFEAKIDIAFGGFHFNHLSELTVQEWVNDALMVVFFFVVGLEIKRELVVGELNDPRAAALPAIAALGGMILPAGIYLLLNVGGPGSHAWGIPMATDIAFAVGVVALVGKSVPIGAKLFLLALAIVDDLGAILVIAIFYTEEIAFLWLVGAGVGLLVVQGMKRANIRAIPAYVAVGTVVWLCVLESGVHATVAGVALALMTPVHAYLHAGRFVPRATVLVERAAEYLPPGEEDTVIDHHTSERVEAVMSDMRRLTSESLAPLDRLELALSPWSSYVIVPIFALANAGVVVSLTDLKGVLGNSISLGIILGLLVGKTVGVTLFAWIAVKTGLGKLPPRTNWGHMIGMGLLAGIGFTVALFVASLANLEPENLDAAKIGIFGGSLVSGVLGYVWLKFIIPSRGATTSSDARDATAAV